MIQRFILAEGLSLETRRVNTMLAFGFLVAVGCTITRIVTQAPLLSLVNQIAFILSVVVAAVAYNKFKLHTLTIYATVIFLNFILFPLTLLLNGGLRADMSGFFAMGIVIIVMLLPWKKALPFVALDIAWTIACYTIVRKFPDIVLTPSNPEYPFIDHIGSFLMIALFFAFVIRVDELLYERERLKVNETAAIISDQAQFRSTVNNAAAALLNASTEDFEKVFFKSLGAVAEHLDMERVYIMRNYNDEDGTYASPVFEWAREAYEDTGTTRFYYDKDTEWYKILFAGDTISGPLNEMSPGMTGILEKFGTKTVLSVPVFRNNAFDGYVFFANHTIERHFSENELGIARSASLIMYNAMLRNETVISLVSAREEALSASKAKSDFLSNMSHEMRTPMNAIMGMLDIARDTDDIEKKDYSLEKMSEASTHLLSIINDVLDMSKIEANKLELSPVDFSFRKLIDKIVTVSAVHVKQDQRFVADIDPEIPDRLHGDDQRLSQVVTNLLSNAMKFTPEGGEIRLDAKLLAKENNRYKIAIHIADTGIGISEEQQALLFSPFQQAESATTRKYGGTGLGLAISKRIVDIMSGEISLESEPGKGSVFTVTLPLPAAYSAYGPASNEEAEGEIASADAEPGEFAGKCLLLAEDVEINREIVMTLLDPSGIEIDCAENGIEALKLFMADPERYDLIFMDMQMPEMDGCEATRRIRAINNPRATSVPIVALTANVFKEDIDRCLAAGMDNHIGKPLTLADITAKLRKYL